ncbi:MAG: hypothetical protein COX62_06730 [Deltaproteobacteria bacterium CG_4_10_14_0_2_um_filter_43_8]|nr:MAG: hypothetical protein COV43_03150 [Deltaproteobacteria bacterium CG11_big_fil_rev_8_21_14_0_20_42_23]PJA19458.1 MAG: hypothetical protein COX62_06730 [Deltaproteobacteria bacterium CG_4_10_14_0_2_um_filter_43_8]PJC63774.1 MAG: hypothetical protein CO021_07765 [Deltaproteobacteria bacterium CG_4_9_14_0_2_um_filter_42_21]
MFLGIVMIGAALLTTGVQIHYQKKNEATQKSYQKKITNEATKQKRMAAARDKINRVKAQRAAGAGAMTATMLAERLETKNAKSARELAKLEAAHDTKVAVNRPTRSHGTPAGSLG